MADFPQNAPRAPQPTYEEPQAGLLSNILAIVGFIILIVVVIWGLVHIAGISSTWFTSLFGKSENVIEITAPENANSGTPFTLSWNYDAPAAGTYALLYKCQGGLQLQIPGRMDGRNSIPCGAAFTLANLDNKNKISLTPLLNGNSAIEMPLSIIFTPSLPAMPAHAGQAGLPATETSASAQGSGETRQAQGNVTIKISPAEASAPVPAPPTAPTPSKPEPVSVRKPDYSPDYSQSPKAPEDLSVRIISVTTDEYGNGTAIFDIANVGCKSSGTYYFTANLPTASGYTYSSPAQVSLSPGSHIVSTLRFSDTVSGVFTVSITTPDINQSNNYASGPLNTPYYNSYNYDNNYPYQYSPYSQSFGGTGQAQYSSAS